MEVKIEVLEKEGLRVPKVTLNNHTFRTEAGALYYMNSDIAMESKMPSVGGFLKAALSSELIFRPTYSGTGELYLEPTAGGIHTMELTMKLGFSKSTPRKWESKWMCIGRRR